MIKCVCLLFVVYRVELYGLVLSLCVVDVRVWFVCDLLCDAVWCVCVRVIACVCCLCVLLLFYVNVFVRFV